MSAADDAPHEVHLDSSFQKKLVADGTKHHIGDSLLTYNSDDNGIREIQNVFARLWKGSASVAIWSKRLPQPMALAH